MLYGLLNLSFLGYILAILVLTHITIVSVTIYLHRYQAHRALELHPIASHFFRFWLWLATGTVTKEWTAIHRKHHAKSESPDDPHSPQQHGIRKVLWQGYELYRKEARNKETLERYGQGTPDDWLEKRVYTPHCSMGILIMLLIDLVLFGVPGITVWAIQMIWIPFFAAGVINGIAHYFGYRNFECPDAARNIFPFGFFIGGEELHNNHHAYGSSAKFSVKWWELDIGWFYIRLLSLLGLAKVKKLPPKIGHEPSKTHIDLETLKVLITNRFQVMAHYSQDVIIPVLRTERRKAGIAGRTICRRAKAALLRSEAIVDETSKQRLHQVLEKYHSLKLVYHYRLKLQEIWSRTTASQKELIDAIQEWCKQAEASGIEALHQFAQNLKAYSLLENRT